LRQSAKSARSISDQGLPVDIGHVGRGFLRILVMAITASARLRRQNAFQASNGTGAIDILGSATMTDITITPPRGARRIYNFPLPARLPGFGIGMAIKRAKSLGIWEQFPDALRRKIKKAKGTWSGCALTRDDLDSISDGLWERLASEMRLDWEYALPPGGHELSPNFGDGRDQAAAA
jgi:hypothetical protein